MDYELLDQIRTHFRRIKVISGEPPKAIMVHPDMMDDFINQFPEVIEIGNYKLPIVADKRIPFHKNPDGSYSTEIWLGDPKNMPLMMNLI